MNGGFFVWLMGLWLIPLSHELIRAPPQIEAPIHYMLGGLVAWAVLNRRKPA